MTAIYSNLSALAHTVFPSQRAEMPPVAVDVKPSTELPPIEETASADAGTNARSAPNFDPPPARSFASKNMPPHVGPKSEAESTVNASLSEEDISPPRASPEEEYRSITNINAVDESGKYLNLRIPLVDEFPDRPLPKVGP
jgi:hypothetical protein